MGQEQSKANLEQRKSTTTLVPTLSTLRHTSASTSPTIASLASESKPTYRPYRPYSAQPLEIASPNNSDNLQLSTSAPSAQQFSIMATLYPDTKLEHKGITPSYFKRRTYSVESKRSALKPRALTDYPKGLITVNSIDHSSDSEEPELQLLAQSHRFEPFIKSTGYGSFGFGNLWSSKSHNKEGFALLDSDPLANICTGLQEHMKRNAYQVSENQRSLADNLKAMDEFSSELLNNVSSNFQDTKACADQLTIVTSLQQQIDSTHNLLYNVFQTLGKLNSLLPESERIESIKQDEYPALQKAYQTSLRKRSGSVSVERNRLSLPRRRGKETTTLTINNVFSGQDPSNYVSIKRAPSPQPQPHDSESSASKTLKELASRSAKERSAAWSSVFNTPSRRALPMRQQITRVERFNGAGTSSPDIDSLLNLSSLQLPDSPPPSEDSPKLNHAQVLGDDTHSSELPSPT
ncbi:hypothetical protein K7432_011130 [Basidiobolus ranarum]|uniref:BLOC-1-related complex subunit 5 n=1 Tax=Basidiobolus ranarum TaxID=34480 RepID=A0ABR2VUF4_9FUNG